MCPNVNSKEWKELVAKFGEERAHILFTANLPEHIPGKQTKADLKKSLSELYDRLGGAYFKNSKEFNTASKDFVVNYLHDKFRDVKGVPSTFGIKGSSFTPYLSDLSYTRQSLKDYQLQSILDMLADKFGLDYELRRGTAYKGKYENIDGVKKVIINPDLATLDTPFHEYFHPFVRLLKNENPGLYAELAVEARKLNMKDEEEAITEMLGRIAASRSISTPLTKFLQFLSEIIFKLTGKHFTFKRSTKLGDVVDFILEQETIDVTREDTLREAYQAIDAIDEKVGLRIEKSTDIDILAGLETAGADLTTDDSSSFYKRNGANVAKRATVFVSSYTEGVFNSRKGGQVKTPGYYRAVKAFSQFKIGEDQRIQYGNAKLTFDELIKAFDGEENRSTLYGKMVHSYLEYRLSNDAKATEAAKANFLAYAVRYGEPFDSFDDHPITRFLDKEYAAIIETSGLRKSTDTTTIARPDKYKTELTLLSDVLKDQEGNALGTTADLVIQHSNGDISLVDYKSGYITSDALSSAFLKYGEDVNVKDSKLSRAKLELTLRAIMIKEKYPESKFNFLRVLKVDRLGYHEKYDTEIAKYLGVVGKYYKENHPEVYKTLNEKGLLNAENYYGASENSREFLDAYVGSKAFHSLPYSEQREYLLNAIKNLNLNIKDSEDKEYLTKEISKYTKLLLEVEGFSKEDINFEGSDIAQPKSIFGTLSDIDNSAVQGLNNEINKSLDKENKEWNKLHSEFKKKLAAVAKENTSRGQFDLVNKVLSGTIAAGVITFNPALIGASMVVGYILRQRQTKAKDYFSFMYIQSSDASRPGTYLNTSDMHPTQNRQLTTAEKEFRDFYRDTIHSLYAEVMQQPSHFSSSRRRHIIKHELAGLPAALPPDFFPRVPISFDEAREHVDAAERFGGVKASLQYTIRSNTNSLLERSMGQSEDGVGVRLKYYAHAGNDIVANEDHSFDPEQHFVMFTKNLLHKKYFDDIYPLAKGIQTVVKTAVDERGNERLSNLTSFLDNQIALQVLRQPKEARFRRAPLKISVNDKVAAYLKIRPGVYEISQDRLLRSMKFGVSIMGMGFNLVGAAFNTAIITITNAQQATSKSIGKLTGLDYKADPTTSTSLSAWNEYRKYLTDSALGRGDENKLLLMAKHLNWVPENYGYSNNAEDRVFNVEAPSMGNTAFMFHNVVENYGALTHLALVAKSTYVTNEKGEKVSVWDAYDAKEGELKWTAGVRGLTTKGEQLTELDSKEIKAMHRVYEKMHGSYRPAEKTAVEASVWGEFLVQFSKYFYTFVKNLYQGSYTDSTDGMYVSRGIKPDGTNIWEWQENMNQGRMRVMAGAIMSLTRGELGTFLDATTKEGRGRRARLTELLNTALWLTGMFAMYAMAFDDDEEQTPFAKRMYSVWKDSSQGLWPQDIVDKIGKPVVILDRVYKTGKTAHTAFLGKSEYERERAAKRFIPGLSTADNIAALFGKGKDFNGKLFGLFEPTVDR